MSCKASATRDELHSACNDHFKGQLEGTLASLYNSVVAASGDRWSSSALYWSAWLTASIAHILHPKFQFSLVLLMCRWTIT